LSGPHDMQVDISGDAEVVEDLLHHLAMLRGRDGEGFQEIGGGKLADHGSEFDGLRTGSDNDGDGSFHSNWFFSGREKFEADRPALEALENLAALRIGEHSAQAKDNTVAIDTVNDDPGARAESRRE